VKIFLLLCCFWGCSLPSGERSSPTLSGEHNATDFPRHTSNPHFQPPVPFLSVSVWKAPKWHRARPCLLDRVPTGVERGGPATFFSCGWVWTQSLCPRGLKPLFSYYPSLVLHQDLTRRFLRSKPRSDYDRSLKIAMWFKLVAKVAFEALQLLRRVR